jgi:hypothetical protein
MSASEVPTPADGTILFSDSENEGKLASKSTAGESIEVGSGGAGLPEGLTAGNTLVFNGTDWVQSPGELSITKTFTNAEILALDGDDGLGILGSNAIEVIPGPTTLGEMIIVKSFTAVFKNTSQNWAYYTGSSVGLCYFDDNDTYGTSYGYAKGANGRTIGQIPNTDKYFSDDLFGTKVNFAGTSFVAYNDVLGYNYLITTGGGDRFALAINSGIYFDRVSNLAIAGGHADNIVELTVKYEIVNLNITSVDEIPFIAP